MILWLLACGGDDACVDAPTWDGWAHGFFVSYCGACHAADTPDRHGAPEAVTFDTEAEAIAHADTIERVVLVEETMPVGGGVFDEDRSQLEAWLGCR